MSPVFVWTASCLLWERPLGDDGEALRIEAPVPAVIAGTLGQQFHLSDPVPSRGTE